MPEISHRPLAHSSEDVRPLHQLCREGRLYDVERWIADGKPIQLTPEALTKGARPKTALQIALETGQHSLATLLLRNGYRLELERYAPLDLALRSRRWDLFDLLLDWGGDIRSVDVYTVLETYNSDLYERFGASGYDLTERPCDGVNPRSQHLEPPSPRIRQAASGRGSKNPAGAKYRPRPQWSNSFTAQKVFHEVGVK